MRRGFIPRNAQRENSPILSKYKAAPLLERNSAPYPICAAALKLYRTRLLPASSALFHWEATVGSRGPRVWVDSVVERPKPGGIVLIAIVPSHHTDPLCYAATMVGGSCQSGCNGVSRRPTLSTSSGTERNGYTRLMTNSQTWCVGMGSLTRGSVF
ncbi:hypothetical protein LZ31DRAFT_104696 [Colletotrichum somersetense]|nr:hypothetical protein LZ31DRAFT_104696 [Colletotrichum somersetense]